MLRKPGPSVRLRLALSYAAVVVITSVSLLTVAWVFLLRYVPTRQVASNAGFAPTRSDLIQVFVPPAVGALSCLLVAGLAGGWLLAVRVLAPLERLTEAARLAGRGSLEHRVQLLGRNDEFRMLADTFDTMLAQLETHVASQQRFAANASHELRTPLAISRALLEVARDDTSADRTLLLERLLAVNDRATTLTEALLLLSRVQGNTLDHEPVDLSLAAEEAAETLLPLAEARGITIEVSGQIAIGMGSPALLLQVVTNLIHNAIVHNTLTTDRGAGGTIWIRTLNRNVPGQEPVAVLDVENTGSELPEELVSTLTEPFQRGAARVRDDHEGSGLGLAIVDAIVRAHGGTLIVASRAGGGLHVTVELPHALI